MHPTLSPSPVSGLAAHLPIEPRADKKSLAPAFVAHSLKNTAKAFMLPTAIGALMPPAMRPMALIPAGIGYAHLRHNPAALGFRPEPSPSRQAALTTVGLLPFVPGFMAQAHVASRYSSSLGVALKAGLDRMCAALPKAVGGALARYPLNFVLSRLMVQGGASITGAVAQKQYAQQMMGAELQDNRPSSANAANAADTAASMPDGKTLLASASLFAIPAALGTPKGMDLLAKAGATPGVRATGVLTTVLVAAAVATDSLVRHQKSRSI